MVWIFLTSPSTVLDQSWLLLILLYPSFEPIKICLNLVVAIASPGSFLREKKIYSFKYLEIKPIFNRGILLL